MCQMAVLSLGICLPDLPHLNPNLSFLGSNVLLCTFYIKEDLCEGCLMVGSSEMASRPRSAQKHCWTSQDPNRRRKSQAGTVPMARDKRLLYLWGSFPLTVRSSLLPETAGSPVTELGLRRIPVSCQGGHWRGLLTVGLLFQGW